MKRTILFFSLALAVFGQNPPNITTKQITLPISASPVAPTQGSATVLGNPGPATYYFWVVANFPVGNASPAGPFIAQNAPNTISASDTIFVSWNPTGAASYDLLLTNSATPPAGACNCAVATGQVNPYLTVSSGSTSAYTVQTFAPAALNLTLSNQVTGAGKSALTANFGGSQAWSVDSTGAATYSSVNGVLNAAQFAGADIGAKVNNAEGVLCTNAKGSGCEIVIPPQAGGYTFSTTINLVKYWVSLKCTRGQILYYTGTGDAVFVGEGSPGPYVQGAIDGCIIDGSTDTNTNVNGIRMVNTTGFAYRDGMAVQNFTATGDVGMLWQNQPTTYTNGGVCTHCADGSQTERTRVGMVSLINNTTNIEMQTVSGAGNSFEYNRIAGLHLQQENGQTGILIDGSGVIHSASLVHCSINIASNTNDPTTPATLIEAENGGEAYNDVWVFKSEETTGSMQIPYNVADAISQISFEANPNVELSGGGAGINKGNYYGPSTYDGNNIAPPTGAEYNPLLSFGGNTIGSMPGIESLGFSMPTGHNSTFVFGGNGLAGIGGVAGTNIQHPYSWCYVLDTDCFEFDTINGSNSIATVGYIDNYGNLHMDNGAAFGGNLYFGNGSSNEIAYSYGSWTGISTVSPQNTTSGFNDRVTIQDSRTGNFDLLANANYNSSGQHYYTTTGYADRIWQSPTGDGFSIQCAPSGTINTQITFTPCASITSGGINAVAGLTIPSGQTMNIDGSIGGASTTGSGSVILSSTLPLTGSVAGSTTLLAANSCGDTVTATVTGATTSMVATATGSGALPSAGLTTVAAVTAAGTVSIEYCNVTTAGITPAALTFEIRVIQ